MNMKKRLSMLTAVLMVCSLMMAAVPQGYYHNADSKKGAELKTALHDIVSHASMLPYGFGEGATWWAFSQIDVKNNAGEVYDIYSNKQRYYTDTVNYTAVAGMHIGHAMASTWWAGNFNEASADLHNLMPVDGDANYAKSYFPLGEVGSNVTFNNHLSKVGNNTVQGYTGLAFEPDDEFKGDFARIYFYMVTKYEHLSQLWQSPMTDNNTYPTLQPWAANMLLQWHRQDPVSQKELDRNEAIFQLQGNRNPFVDYPQLAEHIWGNQMTTDFTLPATTQPYFITPTNWERADINAMMLGNTYTKVIPVEGRNFTTPVQCSLMNATAGMTLSATSFTAAEVNAGATLTLTYTPTYLEEVVDTIIIMGGGVVMRIPVSGTVTNAFMTLPPTNIQSTTATYNWGAYPGAVKYLLDVYEEGYAHSGDLFFSAYVAGSGDNKAVALHNNTGHAIDLSEYEIRRQDNGSSMVATSTTLSGMLANGSSYIIAHGGASASLLAMADSVTANSTNSIMNFSGNDAFTLYHNNVLVDRIGEPGVSDEWGKDVTLIRKSDKAFANAVFNWKEWNILPLNTINGINNFAAVSPAAPVYSKIKEDMGTALSYVADHELHPGERFYYSAYAVTANNDTIQTVNEVLVATLPLDPPLANEAVNVTANSFTVNWEAVPGAMTYLVNVFTLQESDTVNTLQTFDTVMAIGRPLPEGWDGNVTATTSNGGTTAPAIDFTRQGQWLKSERYEGSVMSMSFDYRFMTAGSESYFIVEAGDGVHHWHAIDTVFYMGTTQLSRNYTFQKAEDIRAFRWTYVQRNGGADLALDNVAATYLTYDTTFIVRHRSTSVTYMPMNNMVEGQEYFYNVCAFYCHLAGEWSNTVSVTPITPVDDGDDDDDDDDDPGEETNIDFVEDGLMLYADPMNIYITNIEAPAMIRIFAANGTCIYMMQAMNSDVTIPFDNRGIYVIQITDSRGNHGYKIAK